MLTLVPDDLATAWLVVSEADGTETGEVLAVDRNPTIAGEKARDLTVEGTPVMLLSPGGVNEYRWSEDARGFWVFDWRAEVPEALKRIKPRVREAPPTPPAA